MSKKDRRRQDILVRKRAKRKAAKSKKQASAKKTGTTFLESRIKIAARSPLHDCLVSSSLSETGIGNIIVSRMMPTDHIAVGVFLLDIYCLGVKESFYTIVEPQEYTRLLQKMKSEGIVENIHPSCARKLIEGGVLYAERLGFKPHGDYKVAKKIFGDIDPEDCPRTFEYGYNGKPYYVSGPYDTRQKSESILKTLSERCGPNGFHYTVKTEAL